MAGGKTKSAQITMIYNEIVKYNVGFNKSNNNNELVVLNH